MILSQDDFDDYVEETYPDVTDSLNSNHRLFVYCPYCKARMGLDVIRREYVCYYVQRIPTIPPGKKPDTDYPYIKLPQIFELRQLILEAQSKI